MFAILFVPAVTFAEVVDSYSRTPSTFTFPPGFLDVEVQLSSLSTSQYVLFRIEKDEGETLDSNEGCIDITSTTQSFSPSWDLDSSDYLGMYEHVWGHFYIDGGCSAGDHITSLEGNGSATIFEIVETPEPDTSTTTLSADMTVSIFPILLLIFGSVFLFSHFLVRALIK